MPLTPDDQVKYRDLYLQTAKPYVSQLQDSFTAFTQGDFAPDKIEVAHRSAHSLTSQSKMMSYTQIASLASLIETTMRANVDNNLELSVEICVALKAAADRLSAAITALENNTGDLDLSADVASLSQVTHISV